MKALRIILCSALVCVLMCVCVLCFIGVLCYYQQIAALPWALGMALSFMGAMMLMAYLDAE